MLYPGKSSLQISYNQYVPFRAFTSLALLTLAAVAVGSAAVCQVVFSFFGYATNR